MLEGYLAFPENFTYRGNQDTIILRLRPALESPLAVGAGAHIGNGSNSVELPPKSYRSDDLRVHTADGQVFGYRDKVRVSGTMYYPGSMAKVEFKCGLTNSLYESVSRP